MAADRDGHFSFDAVEQLARLPVAGFATVQLGQHSPPSGWSLQPHNVGSE
jgi:hypothetical protein